MTPLKSKAAPLTAKQLRSVLRRKCWAEDEYHDFEKEGWYITFRNYDSRVCIQAYGRRGDDDERFNSGWQYINDCQLSGRTLRIAGVEVRL